MPGSKVAAFLIKIPSEGAAALRVAHGPGLAAAAPGFQLEPLFTTVPASASQVGLAAPGQTHEWFVARLKRTLDAANPWDVAHDQLSTGLGAVARTPVFIEPDLLQDWPYENPIVPGSPTPLAATTECSFDDQNADLPFVPGTFAWHLGPNFSQLAEARAAAATNGQTIRIAHLDTGYDPKHDTLPRHLNQTLQRNFMDPRNPNDAHDPAADGLLKNPGHGTGTLSILAGNQFPFAEPKYTPFNDFVGGSPDADIVPVRVGSSVVQILTSTIAAGINYAAELCNDEATRVHVVSMSMGGVASEAWADAVNKAYEAGIVYVAAAGNNYSAGFFGLPTRFIVYPARFRRVIAACGVMANARPYYGLAFGTMQGNFGPASKMATAISAYTPNIPWAQLGCSGIVDMDGRGTSAATPQVAAAAALYLQKHAATLFDRNQYPEPWMRIEAARHALFSSADKSADGGSTEKLGNGILRAARALDVVPVARQSLQKTPADSATFSFLRVLTGVGIAGESDPTIRMLALEATQLAQRWSRSDSPNPLESAMPDPDLPVEAISSAQRRSFFEALLHHPSASQRLKDHVLGVLRETPKPAPPGKPKKAKAGAPPSPQTAAPKPAPLPPVETAPFRPPDPAFRQLRAFAIDPSLGTKLETAKVSEITLSLPWEHLDPGPVGEYLEVIDVDPASQCYYEPVNLEDPRLLAQDGLPPSEGIPQFHQQMAYAVASLTIRNFELALGRKTLWRPGPPPPGTHEKNDSVFIRRLRVYPHALRERNAYYTPDKIALLLGYFKATDDDPGDHMPGSMVFTCLSHDIIAHETTHALLDGMNRAFLQPSNPDVLAFHEGFADIVALFQHFTFPEILRHQIAATGGQIRKHQNFLAELAGQFGHGTGMRQALRSAIGEIRKGEWIPHEPDPAEYQNTDEPHARGAILVAAVFDAFLSIYERRSANLYRLATGGTGVLQPGAIHPDLVDRLSEEAAKSAQHVLTMCIRALDYCPPTDITFGEFLRAVLTADFDLVADDDLNYRVSFIEAFRRRGIYSGEIRTFGVESLLWRGPETDVLRPSEPLQTGMAQLRSYAQDNLYTESREATFHLERGMRKQIHDWLKQHLQNSPHGREDAQYLGLDPGRASFEVRTARFAYRTSPDGGMVPQLLLGILQDREEPVDANDPNGATMTFVGGSTVIADLRQSRIRYCIRKGFSNDSRLARQQAFAAAPGLSGLYFGGAKDPLRHEPFALAHRGLQ